jgi:hypothetical protein
MMRPAGWMLKNVAFCVLVLTAEWAVSQVCILVAAFVI